MSALDALLHLLNFALLPLLFAAVAAGLAKLAWPRRLGATAWRSLAAWGAAGALLAQIAGVIWTGRDGAIATYLLLLPACAAGLAWAARGALGAAR